MEGAYQGEALFFAFECGELLGAFPTGWAEEMTPDAHEMREAGWLGVGELGVKVSENLT